MCAYDDDDDDDDDVFKKHSGLSGWGVRYAATNTKTHTDVDSTLLSPALGVSSIYYTIWLSRESSLRLNCLGCSLLQKKDLQVKVCAYVCM